MRKKQKMKGTLEEGVKIPDGVHTGTVVSEELRTVQHNGDEFQYLDFRVSIDDVEEVETLKFGVPYKEKPSINSNFGQLLLQLGVDIGGFDTEKDVVGQQIQYQTITDKKGMARIVIESIKKA